RAAQLLTDAERMAYSVTDVANYKERALAAVAQALATTDPKGAEGIARSITYQPGEVRAMRGAAAKALSGVVQALAATNPKRAERIAYSITDESSKVSALSGIVKVLATTSS